MVDTVIYVSFLFLGALVILAGIAAQKSLKRGPLRNWLAVALIIAGIAIIIIDLVVWVLPFVLWALQELLT